jgi:hypothetical protein
VDQLDAAQPDEEVRFEKSNIEEILQMTFPIDPSLRHKVQEQIRVTASQLPLEQNDAVVSYINFFSSPRGKKILAYGLRRSGRYKPMIEKIPARGRRPGGAHFPGASRIRFRAARCHAMRECGTAPSAARNTG